MKRSNFLILIVAVVVVSVSFIGLYAGHFLLLKKGEVKQESIKKEKPSPVAYRHISAKINGMKQDINVLEIDVSSSTAVIRPILSFDSVFGFEKLSSMASRKGAYAAVNAGFFYEYGRPAGMVCIDGKLITNSTSRFPVFIIRNNKAYLNHVKTELWIASGNKRLLLDNINSPQNKGMTVLYTPEYGKTNRVEGSNVTITIQNNIVTKISSSKGSSNIPRNGMLVTVMGSMKLNPDKIPFSQGERVGFSYTPDMGKDAQGYECGSWIVRNGKVVIEDRDAWVGILTNRDPRTAIGIKNDGKVLIVTVDGRQPGHSTGMTGKELGNYLVSQGVENAAMLDGGASTTMIVKGKIVNRPSYKGEERPLGGGLIIQLTDDN